MLKQLIAFVLQGVGAVAGVVAGFLAHPIAGCLALAVIATLHGVALEHEVSRVAVVPEKRGEV